MPNDHRLVRAAIPAIAAVALVAAVPAPAHACPDTGAAPGSIDDGELRRALRCVVNEERARRGLRRLRGQAVLGEAARGHAQDMVDRSYFSHERPGSTLRSRLRDAGWRGGAAGETIAWGCGGLGVPRKIVDGWLASPPHRDILLGRYRRAGVGLALGAPYATDCPGAGTWVLVLGRS